MFGRKLLPAAGMLLIVGASVSIACGPFFSWQLLDDRTGRPQIDAEEQLRL